MCVGSVNPERLLGNKGFSGFEEAWLTSASAWGLACGSLCWEYSLWPSHPLRWLLLTLQVSATSATQATFVNALSWLTDLLFIVLV